MVLIVQRNDESLLRFHDDLPTVLKADRIYWDQCLSDLEEVENQLENVRRISLHQARMAQQYRLKRRSNNDAEDNDSLGDISLSLEEEVEALRGTQIGQFTLSAIKQVSALRDKVEVTRAKFRRLLEYFGEEEKKWQPHELFKVMATFCRDFEKAKEEVISSVQKRLREERKKSKGNTPNGKPPAGPERQQKPLRASSFQPNLSKVLKDFQQPHHGSSHSPHPRRNEVLSPRSSRKHANSQQLAMDPLQPIALTSETLPKREQNILMKSPNNTQAGGLGIPEDPLPPGMQESGRFDLVEVASTQVPSPSIASPSTAGSEASSSNPKDTLRYKARMRRQRQMQVVSGRTTPIASNTSVLKTGVTGPYLIPTKSSSFESSQSQSEADEYSQRNSAHRLSPRSMIRQRRRLDARKRIGSFSPDTSDRGGELQAAPNLIAN